MSEPMTFWKQLIDAGACALRVIAHAVSGTAAFTDVAYTATLSVAQEMLDLVGSRLADDVRRIKEAHIRRVEARSAIDQAEAGKKLAEAAEAETKRVRRKRQRLIEQREDEAKKAEILQKKAEAAKTEAEADRIRAESEKLRADAEATKSKAIGDARVQLMEAVHRLNLEGGRVVIDGDEFRKMLGLPPPPESLDDELDDLDDDGLNEGEEEGEG